mgnify:FL=1
MRASYYAMPVLSSKNFIFYSGFWLCDILQPGRLAGAILGGSGG